MEYALTFLELHFLISLNATCCTKYHTAQTTKGKAVAESVRNLPLAQQEWQIVKYLDSSINYKIKLLFILLSPQVCPANAL
jgi:hypothetical protein